MVRNCSPVWRTGATSRRSAHRLPPPSTSSATPSSASAASSIAIPASTASSRAMYCVSAPLSSHPPPASPSRTGGSWERGLALHSQCVPGPVPRGSRTPQTCSASESWTGICSPRPMSPLQSPTTSGRSLRSIRRRATGPCRCGMTRSPAWDAGRSRQCTWCALSGGGVKWAESEWEVVQRTQRWSASE